MRGSDAVTQDEIDEMNRETTRLNLKTAELWKQTARLNEITMWVWAFTLAVVIGSVAWRYFS